MGQRWILGGVLAAAFCTAAGADSVETLQYAVVEDASPTQIAGGLFGWSKKPGTAYTIRFADGGTLVVKSLSTDLRPGDCVGVSGAGSDTELSRAAASQCQPAAPAKAADTWPLSGPAGAAGNTCQQAREEVKSWPPGPGRRRALLRELEACAEPTPTSGSTDKGSESPCQRAWAEVEGLPFGPERRAARLRALNACSAGD